VHDNNRGVVKTVCASDLLLNKTNERTNEQTNKQMNERTNACISNSCRSVQQVCLTYLYVQKSTLAFWWNVSGLKLSSLF